MLDAFSEPFGCQSAQGMLRVSRAIKPQATVLLTGDGGDDVFFGYPFFHKAWTAQKIAQRLPDGADEIWRTVRGLVPGTGSFRRMRNFLDYTTGGLGAFMRIPDGLQYFERWGLFGERLKDRNLPQRCIPDSLASARNLLHEVFTLHRKLQFTSEFIPKVDGGTMYDALEARAPFLDQKIWEFATTLPAEVRFHGGELKAVLREIVRRRVSPATAQRKKQGFTVPGERWLAKQWITSLDILRGPTELERLGWIQPRALGSAIDEAVGKQWVPPQLWHLIVLERWLRKNIPAALSPGEWAGSPSAAETNVVRHVALG
jgi:asparagine synthase (glutamine-hydrolysing)